MGGNYPIRYVLTQFLLLLPFFSWLIYTFISKIKKISPKELRIFQKFSLLLIIMSFNVFFLSSSVSIFRFKDQFVRNDAIEIGKSLRDVIKSNGLSYAIIDTTPDPVKHFDRYIIKVHSNHPQNLIELESNTNFSLAELTEENLLKIRFLILYNMTISSLEDWSSLIANHGHYELYEIQDGQLEKAIETLKAFYMNNTNQDS